MSEQATRTAEAETAENREAFETDYGLKNYVDSELQARNIPTSTYDMVSLYNGEKDVMTRIMKARKKSFWDTKEANTNYEALLNQLDNIQLGNERIEERVRWELMGLDENPFKRFLYQIATFFQGVFDKTPESAQTIMSKQLKKVDSVSQGVSQASKVIDKRVSDLDRYYDKLLGKLENDSAYRVTLMNKIADTEMLMQKTEEVLSGAENPMEKLRYDSAVRKLRRHLQGKAWELKMLDREILDTKAEIPFIDTFGDFCQTYSYALKESFQRVQTVKNHLAHIIGLHFEMMRTNHINYALKESVDKLLEYTNNMNKSLVNAKELILDVNRDEIYSYERIYSQADKRGNGLEAMTDEIVDSNANTFRRLEDRVKSFLGWEKEEKESSNNAAEA